MVVTRRGTRATPGKNYSKKRKTKKASPKRVKNGPSKAKSTTKKKISKKKKVHVIKKQKLKKKLKFSRHSPKRNQKKENSTKKISKKKVVQATKKKMKSSKGSPKQKQKKQIVKTKKLMKKSPQTKRKKSPSTKRKSPSTKGKKSPSKKRKSPSKMPKFMKKNNSNVKSKKLKLRMKLQSKKTSVKKLLTKKTSSTTNELNFPKIKANHRFQFDFSGNHLTSQEYYILSEIYDMKISANKIGNKNKNILKLIENLTKKSNLTEKIKKEVKHFLGNSYDYEMDWPFLERDDIYMKARFLDAMYVIKEADFFEKNPNHETMKEMEKLLEEDFANFTQNDPTQYFFV